MTEALQPQSSSMDRWQFEQFMDMAKNGHGWVLPRPDGTKAPCGGPKVCHVCKMEYAVYNTTSRVVITEGFVIKPGDQVLLIAPPNINEIDMDRMSAELRKRHPDVGFTIVAGFTGVQIHRQEPGA